MYIRYLICLAFALANISNTFGAEITIDQLRNIWQAKQKPRSDTSASFITKGIVTTTKDTTKQENTGVIRFNPKCTMLEYDVSKHREIIVCNPEYIFRVARSNDSYNLMSTTMLTEVNYTNIQTEYGLRSMKLYSSMVYDYDSIQTISDKLSVEKIINGSIFLKFTSAINTTLSPPTIYVSGQIELMESNPEIVIGFTADSIINKHKCKISSRYDYVMTNGEYTLRKINRSENYHELQGGMIISSESQFQHEDASNITDADFYLTHFKLPEPLGVTPPPRTGYMMYLYIAIPVFAAVGLFFAYVRRRYFPRAVALPPADAAGS